MLKKIDKEVLFGGVFGVLSIASAIGEMIANGISVATLLGALKDVSGTLVAVMVFVIAIRHLFRKKTMDFDGVFDMEMEKIIKKYFPILQKDNDAPKRYNIATNLDSILGKETGSYHTLFELRGRKDIAFHISKTVFMGKTKDSFDDIQQKIATQVGSKIKNSFEFVEKFEITPKGVKITFSYEMKTNEDAVQLAELVDCVLLLYFVEYKK